MSEKKNIKITDSQMKREILKKYFSRKYELLIFLKEKEDARKEVTIHEIIHDFGIEKKHAYSLLEKLEKENLVKKGDKIRKDGKEYCSYLITDIARQELAIVSSSTNENSNAPLSFTDFPNELMMGYKKRTKRVITRYISNEAILETVLEALVNEFQDILLMDLGTRID